MNSLNDVSSQKHGTNILGLISKGLDPHKYCLLLLVPYNVNDHATSNGIAQAVSYAIKEKALYLNYSGGGLDPSYEERQSFTRAVAKGMRVTVAAGNLNHDLSTSCNFYPACYTLKINNPNFKVVGSSTADFIEKYTNYGLPGEVYEDGTNRGIPELTGTSQSAAIYMNKWIKKDANP